MPRSGTVPVASSPVRQRNLSSPLLAPLLPLHFHPLTQHSFICALIRRAAFTYRRKHARRWGFLCNPSTRGRHRFMSPQLDVCFTASTSVSNITENKFLVQDLRKKIQWLHTSRIYTVEWFGLALTQISLVIYLLILTPEPTWQWSWNVMSGDTGPFSTA